MNFYSFSKSAEIIQPWEKWFTQEMHLTKISTHLLSVIQKKQDMIMASDLHQNINNENYLSKVRIGDEIWVYREEVAIMKRDCRPWPKVRSILQENKNDTDFLDW